MSEYFLFQTLWALFQSRFTERQRRPYGAFDTQAILEAWQYLPSNVVKPERNKRAHLSGVLSRNEVEREYAYNRALFTRVAQGWYQFNPQLMVRRKQEEGDAWVPVYQALNLAFIGEFAWDFMWERVDTYLETAGLPKRGTPIVAGRAMARLEAAQRERAQREPEACAARERWRAGQTATRQHAQLTEPKWGTPEAKRREIERIRKEIAGRKKG